MRVMLPLTSFHDGDDYCEICAGITHTRAQFMYLDLKKKEIVFFIYCRECYRFCSDIRNLNGFVIRYPIVDYIKNYQTHLPLEN